MTEKIEDMESIVESRQSMGSRKSSNDHHFAWDESGGYLETLRRAAKTLDEHWREKQADVAAEIERRDAEEEQRRKRLVESGTKIKNEHSRGLAEQPISEENRKDTRVRDEGRRPPQAGNIRQLLDAVVGHSSAARPPVVSQDRLIQAIQVTAAQLPVSESVYSATPQADGCVVGWEERPSFPQPRPGFIRLGSWDLSAAIPRHDGGAFNWEDRARSPGRTRSPTPALRSPKHSQLAEHPDLTYKQKVDLATKIVLEDRPRSRSRSRSPLVSRNRSPTTFPVTQSFQGPPVYPDTQPFTPPEVPEDVTLDQVEDMDISLPEAAEDDQRGPSTPPLQQNQSEAEHQQGPQRKRNRSGGAAVKISKTKNPLDPGSPNQKGKNMFIRRQRSFGQRYQPYPEHRPHRSLRYQTNTNGLGPPAPGRPMPIGHRRTTVPIRGPILPHQSRPPEKGKPRLRQNAEKTALEVTRRRQQHAVREDLPWDLEGNNF